MDIGLETFGQTLGSLRSLSDCCWAHLLKLILWWVQLLSALWILFNDMPLVVARHQVLQTES